MLLLFWNQLSEGAAGCFERMTAVPDAGSGTAPDPAPSPEAPSRETTPGADASPTEPPSPASPDAVRPTVRVKRVPADALP
jgi:hypothetical protein